MGEQSEAGWLETKTIFENFSRRPAAAKLAYKSFVEDVKVEELKNPSNGAIGVHNWWREFCKVGAEEFACRPRRKKGYSSAQKITTIGVD